jgi:hypothetical protein
VKLTFQSEVHTQAGNLPVRVSGAFVDAAGSIKGLTVLGVLPGAAPKYGWTSEIRPLLQAVLDHEGKEVGKLDPFWWQSSDVAASIEDAPAASWTSGAMTCVFTLATGVTPDDERWLEGKAKIAAPEAYIEKPVRLAAGKEMGVEMGVIENELNHLSLSRHPVYPLMKLRRTPADRGSDVGIRNGAMVFAHDGGMVGVIVATFGGGEFYSIAPIEDVLKWHALSFITKPMLEAPRARTGSRNARVAQRPICGSEEVQEMFGT